VSKNRDEPMTPGLRRAVAFLFVTVFALIGLAYAGLYLQQRESQEAVARVARAASQQRCAAIIQQVSIPVPVPTAGNPSRAWVARFSRIERHRGTQLGCHMPPPKFVKEAS
jgi:Flp pilus assembly protein TadB